ncbi:MAG: hypothetical protein ABR509_08615 [Candidatus Limnocylindria bacterium]
MTRNRTHLSRFIKAIAALGRVAAVAAALPAGAAAADGTETAAGILGLSPEMLQVDSRLLVIGIAIVGVAILALVAAVLSEAVSITRNPVINHQKRRNQGR